MKRIAQIGRAREYFATAPRAAKPRNPFAAHNDQVWKCIVCGHEMKGKCTPSGKFHTASCWHCYTGFCVDTDGTIAAYDLPKPLARFRSWIGHLWDWWKQLRPVEPVSPKPMVFDFNKHLAQVEHEERESYAYNPTAFWLDPLRWSDNNNQPFWMKKHDPVKEDVVQAYVRKNAFEIRRTLADKGFAYKVDGQPHEDYYLGSSQMNPPTLYHTAEDREFAEFYRSKYKTIGAFRRAKTMKEKTR